MTGRKNNGVELETGLNKNGKETATTGFASKGSVDTMYISPNQAIPVIFVPGIMGSPLIATGSNRGLWPKQGKWAWFPDDNAWTVKGYGFLDPLQRKRLLDPASTKAVETPHEADQGKLTEYQSGKLFPMEEARRRGWGSVMINSYGGILNFLETQLKFIFYKGHPYPGTESARPHDEKQWGKLKGYQRLTDGELRKAAAWRFPVYAVGYNWVDTNANAATYLKRRIDEIRKDCRERLKVKCDKVILVTHSMGGLVARMCARQNPDDILGVVHGVQPAIGAGTAYARVRGGWEANTSFVRPVESLFEIVGAWALGNTALEVMSVFANGAGPLELLPNHLYGSGWLNIDFGSGSSKKTVFSLPARGDPYEEIYRVPDKWWRLIHPGALATDSALIQSAWNRYIQKMRLAKQFHTKLGAYYHPNTFAFCGVDASRKGWRRITWRLEPLTDIATGLTATHPSTNGVRDGSKLTQDNFNGICTIVDKSTAGSIAYTDHRTGKGIIGAQFGGYTYRATLRSQDDPGDATVPGHSGLAPKSEATFFAQMHGFGHQGAYDSATVKAVTLYSILHLAATAKPLA